MDPQDQQQSPPPWVEDIMRRMMEDQQMQSERIRRLEEAVAGRFEAPTPTETTTEPTRTATEPVVPEEKRPRPRLPDPSPFGGNVTEWPTWRIIMENKLVVDGRAIGSRQDQFMYVFSRLEKLASKNAGTFTKHCRNDSGPESLLDYLERSYGDPNAQARAARKLHQMKQPDGLSFQRFLPRLEREFADAGAIDWPDQARRQILLGSLNHDMSVALMNRGIPATYSELITRLHEISTDIDTLNLSGGNNSGSRKKTASRRLKDPDEMDWTPTVNAHRTEARKRAKWVSPEEIEHRRKTHCCLRCGSDEHFIGKCNRAPAERPTSSRIAAGGVAEGAKKKRNTDESQAKRNRVKKATPKEEEDLTDDDLMTASSESENDNDSGNE